MNVPPMTLIEFLYGNHELIPSLKANEFKREEESTDLQETECAESNECEKQPPENVAISEEISTR